MGVPRLHKEVSLIDPEKTIAGGIDDASKTAKSFITSITGGGIWVHPQGQGPDSSGNPKTTAPASGEDDERTYGWHIADVLEYFRAGASWFKLWTNTALNRMQMRLGLASSGHAVIDSTGMEVLTDASTSVAKFGSTARIGKESESRVDINYRSMKLTDKGDEVYFHVSDLRESDGKADVAQEFGGTGSKKVFFLENWQYLPIYSGTLKAYVNGSEVTISSTNSSAHTVTLAQAPASGSTVRFTYKTESSLAKAYTLGKRSSTDTDIGPLSYAEGNNVVSAGYASHAEGVSTKASGKASHAEGWQAEARNSSAHAEGNKSAAVGESSHAEGSCLGYSEATWDDVGSTASGEASHAEGAATLASGYASHAEGAVLKVSGSIANSFYQTVASGQASHAEGYGCEASGNASHAQNRGTVASADDQTAIGKWNEEDTAGNYALIVGNGASGSSRSNAFTVDWDGVVEAGKFVASNKVLWSGAYYMTADHTVQLSEKVSEQASGIVLVWSAYINGTAQNYNFSCKFVPKHFVSAHAGCGIDMMFSAGKFGAVGMKYVYVGDSSITGHADNAATGTGSGITYDNAHWVLRYVIGV